MATPAFAARVNSGLPPTPADPRAQSTAKLLLWGYVGSTTMLFAGLMSAYLVRKAEGNWRQYDLPFLFYVTTGIILLSSATVHAALRAARENRVQAVQAWLGLTLGLGVLFLFGQILAFGQLISGQQVHLVGNPSESFLYILVGLHALHLIGALIAVLVVAVQAIRLRVGQHNSLGLELAATFWHALDALWIVMFLFLLLNHL
jgi:cytochrome c oxidase subunit III